MKLINSKIYDNECNLLGIVDFEAIGLDDLKESNIIDFFHLHLKVKFNFRCIFKVIEKNIYLTIRSGEIKVTVRLTKTRKTKKGLNGSIGYIRIYKNNIDVFQYDKFNLILEKDGKNIIKDKNV